MWSVALRWLSDAALRRSFWGETESGLGKIVIERGSRLWKNQQLRGLPAARAAGVNWSRGREGAESTQGRSSE